MVLLWKSATRWGLLAPDGVYLSDEVIDWVWLDKSVLDLFVGSGGTGCCPAGLACYGSRGRLLDRREAYLDLPPGSVHTWRLRNLQVPLLVSI